MIIKDFKVKFSPVKKRQMMWFQGISGVNTTLAWFASLLIIQWHKIAIGTKKQ